MCCFLLLREMVRFLKEKENSIANCRFGTSHPICIHVGLEIEGHHFVEIYVMIRSDTKWHIIRLI